MEYEVREGKRIFTPRVSRDIATAVDGYVNEVCRYVAKAIFLENHWERARSQAAATFEQQTVNTSRFLFPIFILFPASLPLSSIPSHWILIDSLKNFLACVCM